MVNYAGILMKLWKGRGLKSVCGVSIHSARNNFNVGIFGQVVKELHLPVR